MSGAQILVVEDEALVAKGIQSELRNMGYSVPTTASSGQEAIAKAEENQPDLVLMDVVLKGDLDGVQTAEQIHQRLDIPVIYLTAYQDDQTLGRAKLTQPFGYLLKPYEEQDLRTTIEVALHKHRMEQQLKETQRWLATTLQSIADAVIATDAELRVRLMNPAAEQLTGWSAAEAEGRELAEVCAMDRDDWPGELDKLTSAARQDTRGVTVIHDAPLVTRDGRKIPVEGTLAPMADDEGNMAGVVLGFRDVTARAQMEQLRRQK
jgi:PAS domain S-box-containing protein